MRYRLGFIIIIINDFDNLLISMKIINIRIIIFAINKLNVSVYKFFYHNLFSQIKISRHDASAQKVRDEQFCYSTHHKVRMLSAPCAWSGRGLACKPFRSCS